ncbi:MAG TPA: GNAT family protein [Acidimicrobiales bacterium]|nr:GNAT family protein [Acidimicrobiales bacterium]
MAHPHWPLFDVVIRTPRLELRYPDDSLLFELAEVAADGVHDPDKMPFMQPWTRADSPELERNALKFWWGIRSSWSPESWGFPAVVLSGGRVVGVQDVNAKSFAVTRAVTTGSWLGRRHQGRGIGKEMRAAVLHLAFAGLGAEVAYSGAFDDNPASLGVSRSLGYVENGDFVHDREGRPAREIMLKLTRSEWERRRRDDIAVDGLEACIDWFGAGPPG